MSAIAKKRQLEAELAEAKAEQEELYYNRSVDNKQTALDQELESFTTEKEAEIAKLDEYMTNVEAIVSESLGIVRTNADEIGKTLTDKATEYNLTVSSAVLDPWKDGASAIDEYTSKFGDSGAVSATISNLGKMQEKWKEIKDEMIAANTEADKYYNREPVEPPKPTDPPKEEPKTESSSSQDDKKQTELQDEKKAEELRKKLEEEQKKLEALLKKQAEEEAARKAAEEAAKKKAAEEAAKKKAAEEARKKAEEEKKKIKVGDKVKAGQNAKIFTHAGAKNGSKQYFSSDPKYTVLKVDGNWVQVRHHSAKSGVTGWFKKSDLKKYAKGSTGVDKNQLALIDELGEELVLHAGPDGKLQYLTKGTGVVPADITANLMKLGQLNPQEMLDRNRPSITPNKNIVNTEINLDCSVGTLVNIEHCDQGTLPDVEKLVNKAFEKHVQNLNNSLKRFTR